MNNSTFTPLLVTTDWNDEWMRLQSARQRSDDAAIWDAKAKTFPVKHGSQEGYVSRFLELADIRDGESVLDMGCGTGALATPLAQSGHHVIACDFSQGMLNVMHADQEQLGVSNVDTRIMSWEDDWDERGVAAGCVDVALASRSIATSDMRAALMKLDRVARRRVCLTIPCGPSPKTDAELLAAAGFGETMGRDFLYTFNILAQCGIKPEVSYIPNTREERFDTFADALDSYTGIVEGAMRGTVPDEKLSSIRDHLRPWLEQNLVTIADGVQLARPRNVTWAFIAWNKE